MTGIEIRNTSASASAPEAPQKMDRATPKQAHATARQHKVKSGDRLVIEIDGQIFHGDTKNLPQIKKAQLIKKGKNLVVVVDDVPEVELVDFYIETNVSLEGSHWTWAADAGLQNAGQDTVTATSKAQALAISETSSLASNSHIAADISVATESPSAAIAGMSGLTKMFAALGGTLALVAASSGRATEDVVKQAFATVKGFLTLGPVTNASELTVEIYDDKGNLIGTAPLKFDGSFEVTLSTNYSGNVLVKIKDAGVGEDYRDEATGEKKDISLDGMRAVGTVTAGKETTIQITPISELAVRKLGLEGNKSEGKKNADFTAASKEALESLGFDSKSFDVFSDKPIPVIDKDGQPQHGNAYGAALAALSAYEEASHKTTEQVLNEVSGGTGKSPFDMANPSINKWGNLEARDQGNANKTLNENVVRQVLELTTGVKIPEEKIAVVLDRVQEPGQSVDTIDRLKELADTTSPSLDTVVVNENQLVLTFSEDVIEQNLPGTDAFSVTLTNDAGRPVGVERITRSPDHPGQIILTLTEAIKHGHTVSVSYTTTSPSHVSNTNSAIQDAVGNDVANFAHQSVRNNTLNTPPVLSAGSGHIAGEVYEDTTETIVISDVVRGVITDADYGAQGGMAITAVNTASGVLQYTLDGSTWKAVPAVSLETALLLPASATASLRFTPAKDYSGKIADIFTFKAWDQTEGVSGTQANTTATESNAFSAQAMAVSRMVNPVNDAPVLISGTLPTFTAVNEDSSNTTGTSLGLGGVSYGAGASNESSQTLTVTITRIPDFITLWKADGTQVLANTGAITLADLQGLQYKTVANASGTGSVTWTVNDGGGTANGGVDTLTGQSLSVTVNAVNEAPTSADGSRVITDTSSITLSIGDFVLTDPDGRHALLNVIISQLPSFGELRLSGQSITAGQSISSSDIANGLLTYQPVAGESASFKLKVQDNGGTTHGGVDTSAAYTFTLSRAPVVQSLTVSDSTIDGNNTAKLGKHGEALAFELTFSEAVTTTGNLTAVFTVGGVDVTATATAITDVNGARTIAFSGGTVPASVSGSFSLKSLTVADSGAIRGVTTDQLVNLPLLEGAVTDTGYTVDNTPPEISTTTFQVAENSTAFTTSGVLKTNMDGEAVTWRLGTGADTGMFLLAADGKTLQLREGKNFETPASAAGSNAYTVNVIATDAAGNEKAQNITVNVTDINEPPMASNLNAAENYTEDTPLLLTDMVVSDADANATVTVTLTLSNLNAGTLNTGTSGEVTSTYNAATGMWTASGRVADVNTLLAALTFTPKANFNGSFSMDTSVSDGTNVITGSKTFTGTAVNDAPTATNATLQAIEDTHLVLTPEHFGFADTADAPSSNELLNVIITELPGQGTLLLNGQPVSMGVANVGAVISKTDIANGHLVFRAAENANGTGYASLQFKVQDDGGPANSGSNTSTTHTLTLDVQAVNDTPTCSYNDLPITWHKNGDSVDLREFFNDAENGADGLTYLSTSLPNGIAFNSDGFTITGSPTITGTASFTVTATDRGGLFVTKTFNIDVVDAPIISSTLNRVDNLDVRSDLVLSISEAVVWSVGTHTFTITNTANTSTGIIKNGFRTENIDHTQTITVVVGQDGNVTSMTGGSVTINEQGKIVINAMCDLDLSNNYTLDVSDGAFKSSASAQAAQHFETVSFSTVTPGALLISGASAAAQSQMMNKLTGATETTHSLKWLDVTGVGTPSEHTYEQLSAADGDYAFVMKDIDPNPGDVAITDTYIQFNDFGANDLVYIDNQEVQDPVEEQTALAANMFTGGNGTTADPLSATVRGSSLGSSINVVMDPSVNFSNDELLGGNCLLDTWLKNGWSQTGGVIIA